MRYRQKSTFWLRLFISSMMIIILYSLLVILPRKQAEKRDEPAREIAAIKAILEESRLILGSFAQIDAESVSAAESLDSLSTQLAENQNELLELSDQYDKRQDHGTSFEIKEYVNLETQLTDQYQARYNTLIKIVIYNPSEDLKTSDTTELLARAKDTVQALRSFAEKKDYTATVNNIDLAFTLPTENQSKIKASAECFQEYANLLEANDTRAIAKGTDCIDAYPETRKSTVAVITSVFTSELAAKTNQSLADLLAKLDSAPIK